MSAIEQVVFLAIVIGIISMIRPLLESVLPVLLLVYVMKRLEKR